jgi:hypothetical protein
MGLIALTGYNKPDLLYIYLEQLEKSGELDRYKFRFHTEEGFDPDEELVYNDFVRRNPRLDARFIVKEKVNCPLVGFHNILTSYTMSAKETDDFVIIGEEDILVLVMRISLVDTKEYSVYVTNVDRKLKKLEILAC